MVLVVEFDELFLPDLEVFDVVLDLLPLGGFQGLVQLLVLHFELADFLPELPDFVLALPVLRSHDAQLVAQTLNLGVVTLHLGLRVLRP